MLNNAERHVMRHALGVEQRPGVTPYRNYFSADEGHKEWGVLNGLVDKGFMDREKSPIAVYHVFSVTPAGEKALGFGPDLPSMRSLFRVKGK